MKKRVSFDVVVNILLALTCLVVLGRNAQGWWAKLHSPERAMAQSVRPGRQIAGLGGVAWSERNVLLFARSTCRHCTDSMSFYQRLSAQAHQSGARFVVVSEEPRESVETYFRSHDVAPDEVVTASPQKTGITGTPTLAIVDQRGTILESWVGRVPQDSEPKVASLVARR